MIIETDRKNLDSALKDPAFTFMLIFGETNPLALAIHDKATMPGATEDWNKTFLVKDISILKPEETSWYLNNDSYTTLSKPKDGGQRKVAEQNPLTTVCVQNQPASRKIQAAFGRADNT